jgi:hypothetical protein
MTGSFNDVKRRGSTACGAATKKSKREMRETLMKIPARLESDVHLHFQCCVVIFDARPGWMTAWAGDLSSCNI